MRALTGLRLTIALAVVLVQMFSVLVGSPGAKVAAQDSQLVAAPNRYIVRLKSTGGFTTAASVAASYDAKAGVDISHVYTSSFSGFAGEFSNKAASDLANDPNVLDVFPDLASTIAAQTNPPGIERIGDDLNPTNAGNGSGSVNVDIAILDTGVYQHDDLNVVGGKDCSIDQYSNQYTDYFGHGTHVAGSAAAKDNGDGVVGVAPGARIWAVKIFSDTDPYGYTYQSEIICGLDYVRSKASTIEVANMSIGGYVGYSLGSCNAHPYHQASCRAVDAGVTIVVAAGNETDNANLYVPAQFPEVITVSAYFDSDGEPGGTGPSSPNWFNADDTMGPFSNYGSTVDIAAPGTDILSTYSPLGEDSSCAASLYCVYSGTSMASPHVAGAAGLMRAQQGTMSPATVRSRLIQSAEPGPLAGDPDSYKEPLLNVAELGRGKIVSPTSALVGEEIQVRISEFTPGSRAIFRIDGTYMGGDTVDDEGRAHRNFDIPASKNGTHEITVSNGLKTVKKNITINESVRVSPSSGPAESAATIVLRGFASGESVTVKINTGSTTKTLVTSKVVSASGSGNVDVTIPASVKGNRTITATGNKGNSATTTYNVKSTAYVSSGTPQPGNKIRVQFRGYTAGQTVTMRYDTQSGTVLGTTTASATGSGSILVTIPNSTTNGTHYVWVMSAGGNIRVTLTVTGASVPKPPTPAPTATEEPTSTPEPTEAPPTEVPPTEVPPTDVPPTEVPATEVPPTDVPATEVPATEVPPTDVPVESPTPEA